MKANQYMAESVTGLASGFIATKLMERLEMTLYALEPETVRQQEERVRPGPPYNIAARKATEMLGLHLSERHLKTVGKLFFHYGLGMGWGALTVLFQGQTKLNPAAAGAVSGAVMWAVVDEGLTPVLGFSAPDSAYLLPTHVRALIGHLVFGVALATIAAAIGVLGRESARK